MVSPNKMSKADLKNLARYISDLHRDSILFIMMDFPFTYLDRLADTKTIQYLEPESQEKPKRHIFWNSLFGIFVISTQFPFIL